MSQTPNNTLPQDWNSTKQYQYGETVYYRSIIYKSLSNGNRGNNPYLDTDHHYWEALDIYNKDATVMPHGEYSGDENFWDRDHLYIDDQGFVYIDGQKTGMNVRGPAGTVTVNFSQLTPSQIEQIRGPQGERGEQGPQGIQGPQGPMGEVTLTPEQTAALKGDDGKSAYQSWLDQGYTGTEQDFVAWLRSGIIKLDNELSTESMNGITNSAISLAFQSYQNQITTLVNQLQARVVDLEARLKSTYQGNEILFRFGVTSEGNYGYYLSETGTIMPFTDQLDDAISSQFAERNDPAVFQESIGYGNTNVAMTTVSSQLTDDASLTNDPSGTNEDPTILYGETSLRSLADLLPATYLYQNGSLTNDGFGYNLYQVNNSTFISNGEENIEGIWFAPGSASSTGGTLHIVVEPLIENDEIYYQIGTFTDSRGQLPDLVDPGTYRSTYEDGSFTEQVELTINITNSKGCYFASTQLGRFKIIEIYTN